LGDSAAGTVHDLDQESSRCDVDQILRRSHGVIFTPDTLVQARFEGFERCSHCTGY
jgi:hypothetical protein